MRKVLHFDSPREKYHCDASVVSCFDNRFETAGRKLLKRIGVTQPDPIRIAGGAKSLASPEEEFHREFVAFFEAHREGDRVRVPADYLLVLGTRR